MILTGKYETAHVHLFLSVILTLTWGIHQFQKEKENKPRQKVIGLDNAIKSRFKWFEKGDGK